MLKIVAIWFVLILLFLVPFSIVRERERRIWRKRALRSATKLILGFATSQDFEKFLDAQWQLEASPEDLGVSEELLELHDVRLKGGA